MPMLDSFARRSKLGRMTSDARSLRSCPGLAHFSTGHTTRSRGVAVVVAFAMMGVLGRPALAGGDEAAEAQAHLRRAAAAADLGNFAEAAREYEAAYMRTSDANLLVAVGQAWQHAGELQKALTAYRSCARLAPNGGQRALCESKIRNLELGPGSAPAPMPRQGAVGVVPLATPSPLPPYPVRQAPAPTYVSCEPCAQASIPPSPVYHRAPFWIVLGTVVVVGTVIGVIYLRQDKDLAMPTTTFGTKQF